MNVWRVIMKNKKRNIMIAAVLLVVCAAVYLLHQM